MLQSTDLLISFEEIEEKENFMKWFKLIGFKNFMKNSNTNITCLATVEYGEINSNENYTEPPNGYIEMQ